MGEVELYYSKRAKTEDQISILLTREEGDRTNKKDARSAFSSHKQKEASCSYISSPYYHCKQTTPTKSTLKQSHSNKIHKNITFYPITTKIYTPLGYDWQRQKSSNSYSLTQIGTRTSVDPPLSSTFIRANSTTITSSGVELKSAENATQIKRHMKNEEDYLTDATYRIRMSSWSYRIVDYFGASREIVTIAFNYLDRFIDSGVYCCESAYSYKLASITALHVALKVHNRTTIKATTLADLSKGEISATDIIHMESIMLKALDYHLCPPTCQTFIVLFAELLPFSVRESSVVSHIINQAMYIAELSTMHLLMKGVKASVVSVGAMLKVMDMMVDENALNGDDRLAFIEKIASLILTGQCRNGVSRTWYSEEIISFSNNDDLDEVTILSNEGLSIDHIMRSSWWGEVQCCRVLLDEIVALNSCRQAMMDGSDQILPCEKINPPILLE